MLLVEGVFAVVSLVLVIGGVLKLREPQPTREMLQLVGIPSPDLVAHVSAGVEIALGIAALLFGGIVLGILVAFLYAVFTVMMLMLVRAGEAARSCGCFGSLSSEPSILHVAINAVASVIAAVSAVSNVRGLIDYPSDLAASGLPQALCVLAGCVVVIALLTFGSSGVTKDR